jgi:hypothetical protein
LNSLMNIWMEKKPGIIVVCLLVFRSIAGLRRTSLQVFRSPGRLSLCASYQCHHDFRSDTCANELVRCVCHAVTFADHTSPASGLSISSFCPSLYHFCYSHLHTITMALERATHQVQSLPMHVGTHFNPATTQQRLAVDIAFAFDNGLA